MGKLLLMLGRLTVLQTSILFEKPLLRGVVALCESLYHGMKALAYSAQVSGEDDEQLDSKEMAMTIAFSIVLAVVCLLSFLLGQCAFECMDS